MAGYGDRWTADERLSDRRILVVDDEPAIAQLVARLLQEDGYLRLRVTSSPAQAMPLFAELQPHLMLLDLVMPQPDGFAVLKQLMPLLGETYVPVLILTADVGSAAKAQAFALGAVDYVTKPIDKVELLARVRSALRLKEAIDRRAMRERELLEVTQALVEAKQQVEEGMKALDRQHRLLQE
jgi:DNA-binding response OmpR family regulator